VLAAISASWMLGTRFEMTAISPVLTTAERPVLTTEHTAVALVRHCKLLIFTLRSGDGNRQVLATVPFPVRNGSTQLLRYARSQVPEKIPVRLRFSHDHEMFKLKEIGEFLLFRW